MPEKAGLGEIEIDSTTAGVTINVELPDTDPDVAVMIVEPMVTEVASPEVAFTVAMVAVPEDQVALVVRSAVLVSLNVPVAVNSCVSPFARLGFDGVTAIETRLLTGGGPLLPPPPHDACITDSEIKAT